MGNKISQGGAAAGRGAVITGGCSGIGLGVAEHCASLKMKVCIADLPRQEPLMKEIEPRLRELGAQDVMFVGTDVSKMEQVQALHDAVYAKWDDVGYLHNNAGLGVGRAGFDGSFEQSLEHWHLTIDVLLYGVIHGLKAFIPTMLKQGKEAVVVNTGSGAGLANTANTKNGATDMAYTVGKNGCVLLSESLDAAMRSRNAPISVHVLCPYGTETNIGANSAEVGRTFKSEEEKKQYMEKLKKVAEKITDRMLKPRQLAEILQNCIEIGRFYCVTPDAQNDINVPRAFMLARAEGFINDRPPLEIFKEENRDELRKLRKSIGERAHGPIHKLPKL